jgi:transcriptional regulator with XRE-family HTH domain
MSIRSQRRRKVAILTQQGFQKLQAAQSETDLWNPLTKSCTLEDLSEYTGLSTHTVSKVHARKARVDLRTLDRYFSAFNLTLEPGDCDPPFQTSQATTCDRFSRPQNTAISWGLAPDVSVFYGRTAELETLQQWVINDRCHFITLFGIGGVGKTWLATKLAEQVQSQFQSVVWHSVRPIARSHFSLSFDNFLDELIHYVAPTKTTPDAINAKMKQVISSLGSKPHLLVLDNVESILEEYQSSILSDTSDPEPQNSDWEAYREFLKYLAQGRHQSCVVLTSRVELNFINSLAGNSSRIRSLSLQGLQVADIQQMLGAKGTFQGTSEEWNRFVNFYDGNPLILNTIGTLVGRLFDGSLTSFLHQNTLICEDVSKLLDQQLNGLSAPAKKAIAVLSGQKNPLSLSELRSQLSSSFAGNNLLGTLKSLKARSLISITETHVSLNPLLLNYLSSPNRDLSLLTPPQRQEAVQQGQRSVYG